MNCGNRENLNVTHDFEDKFYEIKKVVVVKKPIQTAGEVKNSNLKGTLAHETRKIKFFLFLTVAVFTASMMLSGCSKDKKDYGKSDFPTEKLAEWGLTIKTPPGYKEDLYVEVTSFFPDFNDEGMYYVSEYQIFFYGNASTGAFVKKAFTDSGWTDPIVKDYDTYTETRYSKTGYYFGSLEENYKDYSFLITIQKPDE